MNASLRTLLSNVIDYAGLFPPAGLPLDQAIRNYARYREGPDAWMLGRFVIPANRLSELEEYHDELFDDGPPFLFSVVGPSEPWREGLDEALQRLADFRQRHGSTLLAPSTKATPLQQVEEVVRRGGRPVADVLEMKVPPDLVEAADSQATAGGLNTICAIIELKGFADLSVFFELGFSGGERALATLLEAIALYNRDAPPRAGFKLRTGGLDASAFPTVEQVAFILRACRDAGVPMKFTAGLHHPLRRYDAGVKAHMHGFLNVFVAGVLAHARRLDEETMRAVIADEDPAHFAFTDGGLSWKNLHASTAEVAAARRDFVTSFGSCSFDEPRDDLRALGWL